MTAPRLVSPVDAASFWTPARRRRYAAAALLLAVISFWSAITSWKDRHAFLINVSPSLPNWAFVLETRLPPRRGALIFFNPPMSPLLAAHFGRTPQLFGKYVYGTAGDVVTRQGRSFFVNGHYVATAKPVSSRGEPLAPGPTGTIPPGCYFVATPHKDGFDSRYGAIGWICRPAVVGTGTPVL